MNRTLALFSSPIPYFKGLRPLAGSVTGAILMQQLEYWFDRMGDGFYKFMDSCSHEAYKTGDSWTEELGFSMAEFRTAFDQIGIRYKSKKEYNLAIAAGRLFRKESQREALYCSYFDKIKGLTRYFRNSRKVDAEIEILCTTSVLPVDADSASPEMQIVNPRRCTKSIPGDADSESRYITEITNRDYLTEITHKSEAENFVCEPIKDLASFPEPEEEVGKEAQLDQLQDTSTNGKDKKEILPAANKSSDLDQRSAAAPSSGKSNNGNCWQCPQPELRVDFLKWRSQSMGKGSTITKASNWCNKYPESANDAFAEFLEALQTPPAPQEDTSLDNALESFTTGCGDKLRRIVLNNNFSPEQIDYIAKLWVAGGKRETLTINLMRDEGLIADEL